MAKRDLKNFVRSKQGEQATAQQQAQARDMLKQAEQLRGKSDAQLMEQLMREIQRGKQDGSFDHQKMQQFISQISPMLDATQKKKLQEITRKL